MAGVLMRYRGAMVRVLAVFLSLGLGNASATEELGEAEASAGPAAQTASGKDAYRQLLKTAESQHARGALRDGLAAADQAFELARGWGDPLRMTMARSVRGGLLLSLGQLEPAREELERVILEATALEAPDLADAARINLANALVSLGDAEAADQTLRRAFESAQVRGDAALSARARVNLLRLRVDSGEGPLELEGEESVATVLARLPASAAKAMLLIHAANSLAQATERKDASKPELLRRANAALREALAIAERGDDASLRAQALGHLGALYGRESRIDEGLALTQRALAQAAQSEADATRYPWQLQAAEFQRRLGHRDAAIDAYAATVELLAAHRGAIARNLTLADSRIAVADRLADVYRDYVDLLLRRARETADAQTRRSDLQTARATLEELKGNELRDYFQDDCVVRYREKLRSVESVALDAMIIYPFVLEDRLELLVSVGSKLKQIVVDVDRETLRKEVRAFRKLLGKRVTNQYRRPARTLYGWLITPLESVLEKYRPGTLVFVPDSIFRTIPMAALYDGERFLVERFALGLTPGIELTDPRRLERAETKVLLGGVSESVFGFDALPHVEREIESIHALVGGDLLLNGEFSKQALSDRLRNRSYGLIHIASHAQFGSASEGGFLLTHDGPLSLDAFSNAVGAAKFRDNPLELLILSACETADGGERAALGLSGMAIKAGARSALGSLWRVDDEATADFMLHFYEALGQPDRSRAEAVRAAQRALLENPSFDHPYYWSPFLLINSWL